MVARMLPSTGLRLLPSLNMLTFGFGRKSVRGEKAETSSQAAVGLISTMPTNQICKPKPPERAYSQVADENLL